MDEKKKILKESLIHIADDLDTEIGNYNKAKLAGNGVSFAAGGLGVATVSLALAVPTAGVSIAVTSGVGIGVAACAATVNAVCGYKQNKVIRNKTETARNLIHEFLVDLNIQFDDVTESSTDFVMVNETSETDLLPVMNKRQNYLGSDLVILKEITQAGFIPVVKTGKVIASAVAKGALYTLDDVADDIFGALPKISSQMSKAGSAALGYSFVGLGILLTSIDTGLIIRDMINHAKKNELPSKLIRELILLLDNSSLQELTDQNKENRRKITVTLINQGIYVAHFYVKYWLDGKPIEDLTKNSNLLKGQERKMTFFLSQNAQKPTVVINVYRMIKWTRTVFEKEIDLNDLPYSKTFTLTGTTEFVSIDES